MFAALITQNRSAIWSGYNSVQELDALAEYIALDNPEAASHFVEEVLDKGER